MSFVHLDLGLWFIPKIFIDWLRFNKLYKYFTIVNGRNH